PARPRSAARTPACFATRSVYTRVGAAELRLAPGGRWSIMRGVIRGLSVKIPIGTPKAANIKTGDCFRSCNSDPRQNELMQPADTNMRSCDCQNPSGSAEHAQALGHTFPAIRTDLTSQIRRIGF